jgi:hypothetical protein
MESKMSKCTGFERSAHVTKIHHLAPGDLFSPRRVVKAITHEQVLTPRRVEDALAAANVAIERREQRDSVIERLTAWISKIK